MTRNTAKTAAKAETAIEGAADSIKKTIEAVQGRIEVPAAARDFVKRSAAAGMERAEAAHENVLKATDGAEKFAAWVVGGYARFARGVIDMTHANVRHGFETVEKVAAAQSLNEAVQIQADYVRESAKANFERARDAAEIVRSGVVDGAKTVQGEVSRFYDFGRKAA